MEVLDAYSPYVAQHGSASRYGSDDFWQLLGDEPRLPAFDMPGGAVVWYSSRAGWPTVTTARRPMPNPQIDLLVGRMLGFAQQAQAVVRQEYREKSDYYAGIPAVQVEQVASLVAGAFGLLNPESIVTTLTYDQSLHTRADLLLGAGSVQVSVLLTPGLDPMQQTGEREEEDNTLISVFGPNGKLAGSIEGPLLSAIRQLPELVAPLFRSWAMAA